MHLGGVVKRLRVVAVDLGRGARLQESVHQPQAVHDGEADVRKAALVGPARGVADDDRKHVGAEVVVVGPPDGAAEEETAVAAADVHHQRRRAAEQGRQIERAVGRQLFEGGLRPSGGVEDFAGDRHAELALDAASRLLRLHALSLLTGNEKIRRPTWQSPRAVVSSI